MRTFVVLNRLSGRTHFLKETMKMKSCCRCCADLNDNVWKLYEYEDQLYCESCLLEKLVEDHVVEVIEEEVEEDE